MLIALACASYVHHIYVRVCEVPWEMYRTHRCSVRDASVCPCMGTAQCEILRVILILLYVFVTYVHSEIIDIIADNPRDLL